MATTRRVFIGSSKEAIEIAQHVGQLIREQADMEAVLWNDSEAFRAGDTLIETIEKMPNEYDAAVLLANPDISSRRKKRRSKAPVPNIIFEYGYLSARLTRGRVFLCKFEGAEIPSDLGGMKFVDFGKYEKDSPSPLRESASKELCARLKALPALAAGLPSVSQVHGYSGTWNVQNRFSLWRGLPVGEGDDIFFDGKAFLVLPVDGKGGSGMQIGHLYVFVGNYSATYEIVNEVLQADVDDKGTLKMRVKVIRRHRIEEYGDPPSSRYRTELANKEFSLVLNVAKESMSLEGLHKYDRANRVYQESVEKYRHQGLFRPPGL